MREYIEDSVINPLERAMGNKELEDVNLWAKYGQQSTSLSETVEYQFMLLDVMEPYYKMYLYSELRLCKPNMEFIRQQMKRVIVDDPRFGKWASEQDLIVSAECWGDNMRLVPESKRIHQYFHVLELLLQKDCHQDWKALSEELKQMLFKAEVYSNYRTDEVLCVLHGFTMIMQQNWSKEKKAKTLELLKLQWKFMKYYYSVMIRHIVGVKFTKFTDVSKTVLESSQDFKPHMHIYYSGLMDLIDELPFDKKTIKQMDKICLRMQDEINRYEPSDMLYELCDTLFPEDFQRQLREHRPKSYREVEEENNHKDELIQQMKDERNKLNLQLDKNNEILEKMIMSAIPIENVEAELDNYPPGMSWDFFLKLQANPVISIQPAWSNHYPRLLKKYRERLNEPIDQQKALTEAVLEAAHKPSTSYTNYASGSVHDDKRQQMLLGAIDKVSPSNITE